jgi:hypothetical protein
LIQQAQGREAEAQQNLEIAIKLFPNNEEYRNKKAAPPKPLGPLKD